MVRGRRGGELVGRGREGGGFVLFGLVLVGLVLADCAASGPAREAARAPAGHGGLAGDAGPLTTAPAGTVPTAPTGTVPTASAEPVAQPVVGPPPATSSSAATPALPRRHTLPASLRVFADEALTRPLAELRRGTPVTVLAGLQQDRTPQGQLRTRYHRVVQVALDDGRQGWLRPCVVFSAQVAGVEAEQDLECLLQREPPGPLEDDFEVVRGDVRAPTLLLARLEALAPTTPAAQAEHVELQAFYREAAQVLCVARGRFTALHGPDQWPEFELWLTTMLAIHSSPADQQLVGHLLERFREECRVQVR
ncbi:MAG: hypothetical protein RBU45_19065 [Myxococcota bacterium]|jgi:hypothetical protein|nr:hypothetical protein [Myxococcota bacterium]